MLISDREPRPRNDFELLAFPAERTKARSGATAREYRSLNLRMAMADALALDLALVLTYLIRSEPNPSTLGFATTLLVSPILWVGIIAAFQLYSPARLSPSEEFRRLVEASAVIVGIKLSLPFDAAREATRFLTGGWLAVAWSLTLVVLLSEREAWHKYMWRLRTRGRLSYRTVIVGTNSEAVRIARTLKSKTFGYRLLGFVRTEGAPDLGAMDDAEPVLGTTDDLGDILGQNGVECMFVASSAVDPDLMKRLGKHMRQHDVEVRVSANMTQILSNRLSVQPVGDLLALSLRPVRLTGGQAIAKRTFDVVLGGFMLAVSSPLWITIAILVKLTSRGPILFKQERVGRGGLSFTIYKFRSMVQGAELLRGHLEAQNEASGALFKIKNDPRVTRIGRWLRRWSLDELPQLLNVLKGEMSLVGPRPPLPTEVATYEEWHRDRLEVRPGITGLWQVGGRSELSFDDYVRLDLFYIENWSITYDLFILGKTAPAVILRKGAF